MASVSSSSLSDISNILYFSTLNTPLESQSLAYDNLSNAYFGRSFNITQANKSLINALLVLWPVNIINAPEFDKSTFHYIRLIHSFYELFSIVNPSISADLKLTLSNINNLHMFPEIPLVNSTNDSSLNSTYSTLPDNKTSHSDNYFVLVSIFQDFISHLSHL